MSTAKIVSIMAGVVVCTVWGAIDLDFGEDTHWQCKLVCSLRGTWALPGVH